MRRLIIALVNMSLNATVADLGEGEGAHHLTEERKPAGQAKQNHIIKFGLRTSSINLTEFLLISF